MHWSYVFLALTHWDILVPSPELLTGDSDLTSMTGYQDSCPMMATGGTFPIIRKHILFQETLVSMKERLWDFWGVILYWCSSFVCQVIQCWQVVCLSLTWLSVCLTVRSLVIASEICSIYCLIRSEVPCHFFMMQLHQGISGNPHPVLTHWGRDKMADISQTTFSNVFCWMKIYEFRLIFHWTLFLRVKLTIHVFQYWFR